MQTSVIADTPAENATGGAAITTNAGANNGSGATYAALLDRLNLSAPPIHIPVGASGRRGAHTKTTWANYIVANLKLILEHNNGRKLLCAAEVKSAFVALGMLKPDAGANHLGDAMGIMGLRAPSAQIAGRRYYDLSVVTGTEEDRQRAQAELDDVPRAVLLGMVQPVVNLNPVVNG